MSTESTAPGPEPTEGEQRVNKGRCLCGAITFSVVGEPIYNVICHCENCRRQGGSTLHTASIYLKKQYTVHSGDDKITTYADTATESGKPLYRAFCSTCGSKIRATTPLSEAIVSIPAGILDDAVATWTPHKEQFCRDRCAWVPEDVARVGDQEGMGWEGKGVERFVLGPHGKGVRGLTT